MRTSRAAALLLLLLAAPAARAQTEPLPPRTEPAPGWQPPPRFFSGWARAGAFFPSTPELSGARPQAALGVGLGVGLLPALAMEVEASFTDRDFALPGANGERLSLESRGLAALLRVHHPLWRLEPSATAGAAWLESRMSGSSPITAASGRARGIGLFLGAGLDVMLSAQFSLGVDWRWLLATGRFPDRNGTSVSLSGQSASGVARLYWP